MDDDTASRFVSSLVKSIQALCNGYIDFSSSIEVVGHIHLNIDRNVKLDYVLTEEVSKSLSEGSTVFASHSYHSKPSSNLSKSSGDHSNRNKKSQQNNDTDHLGIGSYPPEVPNATRSESHSRTANRVCDSGDSSLSGSQDFDSVKQENRSSCQVRDSFEKRRRSGPGRRSPSPIAKRGRSNDTNSGVDVIEIKEEPDDEPSVFFGNSAGGADIQTPDFSNVVMESLDRVGQAEGASLVAGDVMQLNKQQPFPVMLHSNMPSTSSSVTGQSDPRASTSGGYFTQTSDRRGMIPTTFSNTTATAVSGQGPFEEVLHPEMIAGVHRLETIPRTGKTPWPQKPCIVCKDKGILRKSRYHCALCVRQPGFCKKQECFSDFHSQLGFPIHSAWNIPYDNSTSILIGQGIHKSHSIF